MNLSLKAKIGIAILILLAVGGAFTWYKFFREVPVHYASDTEYFLYGSIGTESRQGVPYWVWLVLPRLFPEYLPGPGGYASLGVAWEEGREMPAGFSKMTIGIPRVGINCALCHTATYRLRHGDKPTVVAAGPSHQFDPQRYQRFLFACASDPRFTSKNILNEIGRIHKLSWIDTQLYRFAIIPFTRMALQRQRDDYSWMDHRPEWGRGRIDPFNPVKYGTLKLPREETIGNADMVPLWNLKRRDGYSLHWDGLNANLTEVVLSSAIGDGATKKWIAANLGTMNRIQNFLRELPPPKYPLPIDAGLAAKGKPLYDSKCASCHAFGGEKTGKVMPVEEIGTDRHRLDMWTARAAQAYNDYGNGYGWKFSHFVKTQGYVNVPLDGLWLRGPYLHNGSAPSLDDLLKPPDRRPKQFFRGYDVFDPVKVGFVSEGPEAERTGTKYDTSLPGNGNGGHVYGTDLTAGDTAALLEYLKSL